MEVMKPVTTIKAILRATCTRTLPNEYVMAWLVPEPEILYEVRYHKKDYKAPLIPTMIIRLVSFYSEGKFYYREETKYDLNSGNKVRRTKGNLLDFIGKKVYRSQFNYDPSEFFIKFPHWIVKNSPHAVKIASAFNESLSLLTEE